MPVVSRCNNTFLIAPGKRVRVAGKDYVESVLARESFTRQRIFFGGLMMQAVCGKEFTVNVADFNDMTVLVREGGESWWLPMEIIEIV